MNYVRTAILLAGLTALFGVVGYAISGEGGMLIALAVAAAMNVFAWWNSGSMVLRMHNAQQIGPQDAPRLFAMVQALSQRAGLPMPALYVIHEDQPNAFATGRSPENAAVAVNTGLLDRLSEEEVAGVVAHELAHIRNRDTLTMTITATLAGAISMLAQVAQFGMLFGGGRSENRPNPIVMLLTIILAPLAAMLVQMAISRSREYAADRMGAQIAGDPRGLASALQKLESYAHRIPNETAEAAPATAHMFIVNPLSGRGFDNWFATHPSTANRIAALMDLARNQPGGGGSPWTRPAAAAPRQDGFRNPWG